MDKEGLIKKINDIKTTYSLIFSNILYLIEYEEFLDIFTNEEMVSIISLSRQNLNCSINETHKKNAKINTKNIILPADLESFNEKLSNFYFSSKLLKIMESKIKLEETIIKFEPKLEVAVKKIEKAEKENQEINNLVEEESFLDKKIAILIKIAMNEGV